MPGSIWAAIPWTSIWLEKIDTYLDDYKLGLDLHGGIELDYLVDFSNTQNLTPERKTQILEDMKTILMAVYVVSEQLNQHSIRLIMVTRLISSCKSLHRARTIVYHQ